MKLAVILSCSASLLIYCSAGSAAEEGEHHLPHNHIALLAGIAEEEQADGHHESGNVLGIAYIRQFREHWGWGASFEMEVLGNHQKRTGILTIPVAYMPDDHWRLYAAPGIEFRERGDPDKAVLRLGAGYEFDLGEHVTLSPELMVDFIAGGTKVYLLMLSLGYGF
jgi:hypothetical protein